MQGCICPHPPLLIPAIGGDHREQVRATVEAMERLAAEVSADLAVVISPHTPGLATAVAVRTPPTLAGDFGAFRCPEVGVEIDNDLEFVDRLLQRAAARGRTSPSTPSTTSGSITACSCPCSSCRPCGL